MVGYMKVIGFKVKNMVLVNLQVKTVTFTKAHGKMVKNTGKANAHTLVATHMKEYGLMVTFNMVFCLKKAKCIMLNTKVENV